MNDSRLHQILAELDDARTGIADITEENIPRDALNSLMNARLLINSAIVKVQAVLPKDAA